MMASSSMSKNQPNELFIKSPNVRLANKNSGKRSVPPMSKQGGAHRGLVQDTKTPQYVQINFKMFNNFISNEQKSMKDLNIEKSLEHYLNIQSYKNEGQTPTEMISKEINSQLSHIKSTYI